MTLTRRTLVLTALALWLGGFTFYSAVVVPIGSEQLGFATQGFVTQKVTAVLNVIGVVALVPLAWDAWVGTPQVRWQRVAVWLALAATLAGLWALHPQLAELMDPAKERVRERTTFRRLHLAYLQVSTVQWLAGVLYLVLTVRDWRRADQAAVSAAAPAAAASAAVGPA